jgi:ribosomal protein S8E
MSEITRKIRSLRWQQMMFIMLMVVMVAGTDSCKSTGKMSKKERKAQIENAKKQLQPIIAGTTNMTYEEQKRVVTDIMGKNLNDPILNDMIVQAQQKLKAVLMAETEAKAQKVDGVRAQLYDLLLNKDNKSADELEMALAPIKKMNLGDSEIDELIGRLEKKIAEMRSGGGNLPVKTQLENAFVTIANAGKTGNVTMADQTISKTLQLFTSDDAPVLIIISKEGSMVDYDKPTTIKRYLNFLKDTKASKNDIDAIMTDATGKIKELDLIKK